MSPSTVSATVSEAARTNSLTGLRLPLCAQPNSPVGVSTRHQTPSTCHTMTR